MKTILKILLVYSIILIAGYLLISFVTMDFDIRKWSVDLRGQLVSLALVFLLLSMIVPNIGDYIFEDLE